MRLESVTRHVPSRSAAQKNGSESVRVAVSVPRVQILERDLGEDRPRWKGRPVSAPLADEFRPITLLPKHTARPVVKPLAPAPAIAPPPEPDLEVIELPRFLPVRERGLTPRAQALALAARESGIPLDHIRSDDRPRRVVRARWFAAYLLRCCTTASDASIGRYLGGKDHTTILHALRRVDEAIGDRLLPADLEERAAAAWEIIRGIK